MKQHTYGITVRWTGNTGAGTASYRSYERRYDIEAPGRPAISGSSDPAFRGDATCWNPEQLLVAALSACHKLWYLHLCSVAGVVVTAYEDHAEGLLAEQDDGAGQFTRVTLRPIVTIARGSDPARAHALHAQAHAKCFVARSVNFPVETEPTIRTESGGASAD